MLLHNPSSRMLICTHSNSAADLYVEDIQKEWTSMFLVVVYCTKLMCTYDTPYFTCCLISKVVVVYVNAQWNWVKVILIW